MSNQFEELLARARDGSPEDKKRFAYFCMLGDGGTGQNNISAFEMMRRAAEAGDAEAQYMVGMMYESGLGKTVNKPQAEKWLMLAAESGFPQAQRTLKDMFPERAFTFPEAVEPAEKSEPAKPSFRDLAFKKNENGDFVVEVKNFPAGYSEDTQENENTQENEDTQTAYRSANEYDESNLYASMELTITEPDPERDADAALENLVGLASVKKQIDMIRNKIAFDQKRKEAGLNVAASSNHFAFMGNPGTGKTEVARILGQMFVTMGLLERGHVVEIDSGDLQGAWRGWTALKTKHVIKQAIGGVLLIDEAYALHKNHDGFDYGSEAIATLIKAMEDQRENFIVIMTGYPHEMKALLKSNPGFQSRVRHHLDFPDFKASEMLEIFTKRCTAEHFTLHSDAITAAHNLMRFAVKFEDKASLGNARFVRNVFEKTLEKMALRVIRHDLDDLQTIMLTDIPTIEEIQGKAGRKNLAKTLH